jgi:hypothetical protein
MNINPRISVVKWSEFLLNKHGSTLAPAACCKSGKSTGKSIGFNQPDLTITKTIQPDVIVMRKIYG